MRCMYCGNDKLTENDRCCFNCGRLNDYNEENKNYKDEIIKLDNEEKTKYKKIKKYNPIILKLCYLFDFIYIILMSKIFSLLFMIDFSLCFTICLIIGFYRLTILRLLLYKCNLWWPGVYIPFYGFLLIFELGFINVNTLYKAILMLALGPFLAVLFIIVGEALTISVLIGYVILGIIFIYYLIVFIKICDTLCYRFSKNKKFKILLIMFFPITILFLAFGNESGAANFEDEDIVKV